MQSSRLGASFWNTLRQPPQVYNCVKGCPNETVAVITLGTPFGEVSCFGFRVGHRTMGTSWKLPIQENGLFCFVLLCICMHPSCPVILK